MNTILFTSLWTPLELIKNKLRINGRKCILDHDCINMVREESFPPVILRKIFPIDNRPAANHIGPQFPTAKDDIPMSDWLVSLNFLGQVQAFLVNLFVRRGQLHIFRDTCTMFNEFFRSLQYSLTFYGFFFPLCRFMKNDEELDQHLRPGHTVSSITSEVSLGEG